MPSEGGEDGQSTFEEDWIDLEDNINNQMITECLLLLSTTEESTTSWNEVKMLILSTTANLLLYRHLTCVRPSHNKRK